MKRTASLFLAILLLAGVFGCAPRGMGVGMVTAEEAQNIALAHAGLTQDQVQYLRTEYEVDQGVPQFEVEFHYDGWEYDYEISAETGEILSQSRGT